MVSFPEQRLFLDRLAVGLRTTREINHLIRRLSRFEDQKEDERSPFILFFHGIYKLDAAAQRYTLDVEPIVDRQIELAPR